MLIYLVRKNIQMSLANKLKDITQELKRSEKEHFLKVQELHGEGENRSKDEKDKFLNDDSQMQQMALEDDDETSFKQKVRS
jgi:hypothetical protein